MLDHYNDVMTVADAAEVLGVGKNTIYELISKGILKSFRIGKIWKIPKEAMIEFIRTQSSLI